MKRFIVTAIVVLWSVPAQALTIPFQTISGRLESNGYRMDYRYDLGYIDDVVTARVGIGLVGERADAVNWDSWEYHTERVWNTDALRYPFRLDMVREDPAVADYVVEVVRDDVQWDALTWSIRFNANSAAHEVGHMLGLYDQYPGGMLDPDNPRLAPGYLMGIRETKLGMPLMELVYYDGFFEWTDRKIAEFVPSGPGGGDPAPVPEPATILLLGSGLAALAWRRRRG